MRSVSHIAAAFLCCIATISYAITIPVRLGANPDGVRSTAFTCVLVDRSDCAPPTTGSLTYSASAASLPVLTNLQTGSSYSENSRAHFSGTAAAACTLSLTSVSGDSASGKNWSYSSDNLVNTGVNPGSIGAGVLKEGCTTAGNTVYGPDRAWSFITPPSAEVIAPTIPTGLVMTPGAGTCTFAFDAASDPYISEAGSGLDQYDLRCGSSIVHTITGATRGLSQAFSLTNIGSSTPSPTGVQTGNSWALTAGGAGFQSTNNQWPVWTTSVTGDLTLTAKVSNFTSALSAFSSAGLIVMESAASGSKLFACYLQESDQSVQCKARPTTSGVAGNLATISGITASTVWFQIQRTGDIWIGRYSLDGNAWLPIVDSNYSLSMSSGVQSGFFAHSHVNGSSITATVSEVNLTSVPRVSYAYTTASACSATARSRDVAGNNSAYGAAVSCTPAAPAVPARKWNPGYYLLVQPSTEATERANMDAIDGLNDWVGVQKQYKWAEIEATQGVYDFARMDRDSAYLAAKGKKLVVQIEDRVFNSNTWAGKLPDYLNTMGCIYVSTTPKRVLNRNWNAPCNDRYIALFQAIGAHVEADPNIEMVATEEVTPGINPGTTDFVSRAQLSTQWQQWANAMSSVFKKTNLCHYTNSLSNEIKNIAEVDYQNGIGLGGPDVIPNQLLEGDSILQGVTFNAASYNEVPVRDYRGTIPVCYAVQTPELGGKEGNFTPAQFVTFMNGTLHATHIFFVKQMTATNGTGTTWPNFRDYVNGGAHPLTHTTCPSQNAGGCTP